MPYSSGLGYFRRGVIPRTQKIVPGLIAGADPLRRGDQPKRRGPGTLEVQSLRNRKSCERRGPGAQPALFAFESAIRRAMRVFFARWFLRCLILGVRRLSPRAIGQGVLSGDGQWTSSLSGSRRSRSLRLRGPELGPGRLSQRARLRRLAGGEGSNSLAPNTHLADASPVWAIRAAG